MSNLVKLVDFIKDKVVINVPYGTFITTNIGCKIYVKSNYLIYLFYKQL